jgi:hypothetical protein
LESGSNEAYIGYIKTAIFRGKTMTSSTMSNSGAVISPFFGEKAVSVQPSLSLREWLGVFKSALAMANTVPSNGHVGAKQVERVRAMAAAL